MTKPVIGFIGLGLMGGNMVENLQNKGFELIVMDLNKEAVATDNFIFLNSFIFYFPLFVFF